MRRYRTTVCLATALTLGLAGAASAAPGDPDTRFNANVSAANPAANQMAASTALQPDGSIITVGRKDLGPGKGISRYLPDGVPDVSFNIRTQALGLNTTAWTVAVQSDGKILVGGQFCVPNCGIIRLNPDGSLDQGFRANTAGLFDGGVWHIHALGNGKILVGGAFKNQNGRLGSKYFARLNADGTADAGFNGTVNTSVNLDDWVQEIAVQPDGKILLGGFFQNVLPPGSAAPVSSYLVRLNSSGTVDTAFSRRVGQALNNDVESVSLQPDGRVLVAGHFSAPAPMLARFNSNGSPDTSFNNAIRPHMIANQEGMSVEALPNRIVLGGDFRPGEAPTPYVTAFTYAGQPDAAYNAAIARQSLNGEVQWITKQSDGKTLLSGDFTAPSRYVARVEGDPPPAVSPPVAPAAGTTAAALCTQSIYQQGKRTIRWDKRKKAYKVTSRIRIFEDAQRLCRTKLTVIYRNANTKVSLPQKSGSTLGYRKLRGKNFDAPVISWPTRKEMRFTTGDSTGENRKNARLVMVSYLKKSKAVPKNLTNIELVIVRRIPRNPAAAASPANPLFAQKGSFRSAKGWATVG